MKIVVVPQKIQKYPSTLWDFTVYAVCTLYSYSIASTVNQGLFSCNYQDVNCKHVFLFLNSVIQNQKATVSESSLLFLSWNYFPTQTTKCSLNFKKPFSTDLMTNFEIHGGSFWYSPNLLVQKICDRDVTVCVLIYEIEL